MKLKIEINLDNAAFEDNDHELYYVLDRLKSHACIIENHFPYSKDRLEKIVDEFCNISILDNNGNKVGKITKEV